MKYYTNECVKSMKGKEVLIVLVMKINDKYIGVAQNDKEFVLQDLNGYAQQYDFLVCYKVTDGDGEYLVPIGYSDDYEWANQEYEYI